MLNKYFGGFFYELSFIKDKYSKYNKFNNKKIVI